MQKGRLTARGHSYMYFLFNYTIPENPQLPITSEDLSSFTELSNENSKVKDHLEMNSQGVPDEKSKPPNKRDAPEESESQEEMKCKNCNDTIQTSILHHFARTKMTKKCKEAYSKEEIDDHLAFSERRKKMKQSEYKKKYKERIAEQKKEYRHAKKDEISKQQKDYRHAKKDEISKQKKDYRHAKKDEISKQQKDYRHEKKR